MCIDILSTGLYLHHLCAWGHRGQKRALDGSVQSYECWESKLGPLVEQSLDQRSKL